MTNISSTILQKLIMEVISNGAYNPNVDDKPREKTEEVKPIQIVTISDFWK